MICASTVRVSAACVRPKLLRKCERTNVTLDFAARIIAYGSRHLSYEFVSSNLRRTLTLIHSLVMRQIRPQLCQA